MDQILNIAYAEMLKLLDPEDRNAKPKLDALLQVQSWTSPLSRKVPQIPVDGPWWWRGEEDASDSFLQFARSQGESL